LSSVVLYILCLRTPLMSKIPAKLKRSLHIDLIFLIASIAAAVVLAKSGLLEASFEATKGSTLLASFVAGFFFTSVFTAAPATVVFIKLVQVGPLMPVALVGAAGAVLGDLLLFRFLRDHMADDLLALFRYKKRGRAKAFFRSYAFRWVMPAIGAVMISLPFLPDELGVALMGAARLNTLVFMPISYAFNMLGILGVALVVSLV
jgi:hypothetical protein